MLLELLGPAKKSVLEVCCGTGRVLIPLARAGHQSTGIDSDEAMLKRLAAKAEGLENIEAVNADALCANWGEGFDAVILTCNSLMNVTHSGDGREAQIKIISKAAGALAPGGHFFLASDSYPEPEKIFVAQNYLLSGAHSGTDDGGVFGQVFDCGGLYNPITRIAVWNGHTEFTLPGGETFTVSDYGSKYVSECQEVREWLRAAGFAIEREYGGFDKRPFTGAAGWDVIWARKL
ncbi:MAG: methyltransferase domain-containing protein [Defluviitaleaceae bacterium]|nr:methyltransferase domain-containing protein [Defluviitaleaceae bacterium]